MEFSQTSKGKETIIFVGSYLYLLCENNFLNNIIIICREDRVGLVKYRVQLTKLIFKVEYLS